MQDVYLDNNATTKLAPEAKEAMLPYFDERYGNPSSLHRKGIDAERALKESRRTLASLLGIKEYELCFTSGATEADNLAIKGIARASKRQGNHIVTAKTEHDAVLESCHQLEREGFEVTYLNTDEYGAVSPDSILSAIRPNTILAALMHVNNELGTIHPISEIAKAVKARKPNIRFFSDGVQAFGKLHIDLSNIDLYAISSHKIHGPKGIGALVVKEGTRLEPLIVGGGQEQHMRSGTENVPGAVGFAKAAQLAYERIEETNAHFAQLKKRFIEGVTSIEGTRINSPDDGLPSVVNAAFPDIPAEVLLHALEERGIYVSTGSACSSAKKHRSHVLEALHLPEPILNSSLRFSFSRHTTTDDISYTIETLQTLVPQLRTAVFRPQ